jgi:hypothetical protein
MIEVIENIIIDTNESYFIKDFIIGSIEHKLILIQLQLHLLKRIA